MDHRIRVTRKNGIERAFCTECSGGGETWNSDASGNPALECLGKCEVCDGRGKWRISPLDSLERLAVSRRELRQFPSSPWRNQSYGKALQEAVSPVCKLPADPRPVAIARAA